jgi:pilus assembly protein CpaE
MPRSSSLTALLISPNREMADQFNRFVSRTRAFQIVADLKEYPAAQTLDMRIRQLRPDVVLVDLASNLDSACDLIRTLAGLTPPVHAVGLHIQNDSSAVLRSLRVGASEFLYAPFDAATQEEAIARIQRLVQPDQGGEREQGKIIVFTSTKPGSGASTLATQTAFALGRRTRARVLLIDLDLLGGAIGFHLGLDYSYSVLDFIQHADRLDVNAWSNAVVSTGSIDVLPAPDSPYTDPIEPARLHEVLHNAKQLYDWVVVDTPAVFHRVSLLAISESDKGFLISTPELASLHLARKGVKLLNQLGFDSTRYQVLINRVDRKSDFNGNDIGKLLECSVDASMPNDFFSLQRIITSGEPLAGDSDLGRAIEGLANKLTGAEPEVPAKKSRGILAARPAWSQL